MRHSVFSAIFLALGLFFVAGCGGVSTRPEASEMQGKVTIAGGISPKDLTITFQPRQNTHPGGAKIAADGSFTVKLTPGKYAYFFEGEANAKIPAYKKLSPEYHKPSADRVVSVSEGAPIMIEVK